MASYRLRVAIPASEIKKHGYRSFINEGDADIVVFSKPHADDVEIIQKVRDSGAKSVVDLCDDHFDKPIWGEIYTKCAKLADRVTCATEEMARRIYTHTKIDAQVVPDTWEHEALVHANGDNFLWFGHESNIKEIYKYLPMLKGVKLRLCTGNNNVLPTYIPWSEDALKAEFALANVVILPVSDPNTYKSANRLISAVMAGCFVVAENSLNYRDFCDYVYLGSLKGGMQYTQAFSHELNELTIRAQDYIASKYSPERIGAAWASVFDSI